MNKMTCSLYQFQADGRQQLYSLFCILSAYIGERLSGFAFLSEFISLISYI